MEWAYFQQIVTLLLGRMAVFQVLDDRIEFTIETETFTYFREEFDSTIAQLKMYRYTPTQCYSPREYEVFVEPVEPRYGYRIIDEPIEISDDSSAYRLGSPSDELVLAFLSGIPSDSVRNYRRILSSRMINVRTLRNDAGEIHLLDLIKKVTKISLSLKISLSEGVSAETMLNRATSFLFSVAYNTDTAVKIIHSVNTSDKLPKKIAARIYKTRNALVHHKSNTARLKERGIYHPFKDEAELSNEIPLMRFVAEAIIIKTATEI